YARSVLCSSPRIVTFFVQAEYGIRAFHVTGVQTCALPIFHAIHHHRDHACALVEMAQRGDSALTREGLSACRFCTRDLDRPQPRHFPRTQSTGEPLIAPIHLIQTEHRLVFPHRFGWCSRHTDDTPTIRQRQRRIWIAPGSPADPDRVQRLCERGRQMYFVEQEQSVVSEQTGMDGCHAFGYAVPTEEQA